MKSESANCDQNSAENKCDEANSKCELVSFDFIFIINIYF